MLCALRAVGFIVGEAWAADARGVAGLSKFFVTGSDAQSNANQNENNNASMVVHAGQSLRNRKKAAAPVASLVTVESVPERTG